MEVNFNLNRFDGKAGITIEDFKRKEQIDSRLLRHKASMEKLNDISDIPKDYVNKWSLMSGNKNRKPTLKVK